MSKHDQSHRDLPADQLKRKSYLYLYLTNMVQKEFYKNDGKLVPKHLLDGFEAASANAPFGAVNYYSAFRQFYRKDFESQSWLLIDGA